MVGRALPPYTRGALDRKLDLRVTVVGGKAFAVAITDGSERPVNGDWRAQKDTACFVPYQLPADIERRAIALTHRLGLSFGGIDLAVQDEEFYFIEINPTGEWSWLVDAAGLPIDVAIADVLCG